MPLNHYNMNNPAAAAAAVGMNGSYMEATDVFGAPCSGTSPASIGMSSAIMHNASGNVTPASMGMVAPKIELYDVHRQIMQSITDFSTCSESLKLVVETYTYVLNAGQTPEADTVVKRLIEQKAAIVVRLQRTFIYYERLQDMVITELKNWRRQQALAGNGAQFSENVLDEIQRCFELLETFVTYLLAAVKEAIMVRLMNDDPELTTLHEQIHVAQKNLVCSAFIVDKQPPQVMKTNTRFAASVRWLIGSQMGIHMNPPTVECIIMSGMCSDISIY